MTELMDRLNRFEHRLRSMETELYELRRLARQDETPATDPEPPIWETLAPAAPEPDRRREPTPVPVWAPTPKTPREPIDLSSLLGARTLAWTGGAVMLLGIVFFFVLAVERGWIGPVMRVTLGATASAIVVGAGIWLRRRFGDTYASVSAAGVGIAGFYATLLAAAALYDLVPAPVALVAAAGIAAVGAGLAIGWTSQTLATLGLLGAMLVPVPIGVQDGHLSAVGVGFAAVVFAAALLATIPRNWLPLYSASVVVTGAQAIVLVEDRRAYAPVVVALLWLFYGGGATWLALRTKLTYLPASLLMLSGAFGAWSAGLLYEGTKQGVALLVVAGTYAAASLSLWRRDRDTAGLHWAIALTIAAVGAASLASGPTLTIVWAAEAAILAWLARRISEPRFQVASLGWLILAIVHGLAVDSPPTKLFVENTDAWRAMPGAVALAVAAAFVAFFTFEWEPREEGIFARAFADLLEAQLWLRRGAIALASIAALYAASLGVVSLPTTWDWGHVAVAALWSAVAVALVLTRYRTAAFVMGAASAVVVIGYDLYFIREQQHSWAFASVAGALLVVAIVHEWLADSDIEWPSLAALVLSVGLATAAITGLVFGDHARGTALLALAAGYGAFGVALLRRRRNFASALGIAALLLAAPASVLLLDGTWLVLAWAATCASLVLLARFEDRLSAGALAYFGLAFVHTLVMEAKPSTLFVEHRHPGSGIPAVALVLVAAAVIAWRSDPLRTAFSWLCGALGLYAATLAILEASEDLGGGIHTAFQRGHTAVSFLWGIVGLALLVGGLKRGGRHLQIGGFALFGMSLVKLFLYDLAFLSSVARALSFLAVGAVILVGGFFYQRLAALESRT
jgi:uncharacterized membrane protein